MERRIQDIKEKATRAAAELGEDVDIEALFDEILCAENDTAKADGASPWQLLLGRTPPGLGLESMSDQPLSVVSRAAAEQRPSRLEIKRACWQSHVDWELGKQAARAHLARTRAQKVWTPGERCWYWRSKPRGSTQAVVRSRTHGAFCGPATVLMQQCRIEDGTQQVKHRGIVWLADGNRLIRCHPSHLRAMQGQEKILEAVMDTNLTEFKKVMEALPEQNYDDLVDQAGPPGTEFEEPVVEPAAVGPSGGDDRPAPSGPTPLVAPRTPDAARPQPATEVPVPDTPLDESPMFTPRSSADQADSERQSREPDDSPMLTPRTDGRD